MKITHFQSIRGGFTLVEIMVVVGIISTLAAITLPSFKKYMERAKQSTCIANLKLLQSAKDQWALEAHQAGSAAPIWSDLVGPTNYIRTTPTCPATPNLYNLGTVDTAASCASLIASHVLP